MTPVHAHSVPLARHVSAVRWAIYYAPPADSALWNFGCDWLGRDAETGAVMPTPAVPGCPADTLHALTAAPRRYGFHATLKAPFRLARGHTGLDVAAACRAFASLHAPFPIGPLAVDTLDGYLALRPDAPSDLLNRFAFACVRAFDSLRAPPGPEENARRLAAPLNPRQREMLAAWGYPYVDTEYRFHMTLTDRLQESQRLLLQPWLAARVAALAVPPPVMDAICLYAEPEPGADFRLVERYPLGR